VDDKERELLEALSQKSRDPVYFSESIFGVKLNPGQKRWFRLMRLVPGSSFRFLFKRVIHVAANQIGKSLGLALLILWANHTKMGLPNHDWDSWLSLPYRWYHLAPSHPLALRVYNDIGMLITGSHPAQYDKETGKRRAILWSPQLCEEVKFDTVYPGYRMWNGAEIHFHTTAEKAKGIQGVVANGVSIDEAAFEDFLKWVLNQAVKLRLAASGGPLWLISTPNGINDYFELVEEILDTGIQVEELAWEDPNRKQALCWSHIQDNVGFGLSQEEVDFMEVDVDPATKEQQLRGAFLEPKDAFFTPAAQISEAFDVRMADKAEPQHDHRYVIFWDPSVQSDPTVLIVIDVTRKPFRGVYFQRWERPMGINALLSEMHKVHAKWNTRDPKNPAGFTPRAVTAYDSTSMGGAIIRQQLTRLSPQRALNFAGNKVKINALTNLRAMLSRKDILLPKSWTRVLREILSYRLEDAKLVQDCVLAAAGAAQIAVTGFSGSGPLSRPFNNSYQPSRTL
jgi:hypothetical protein